MLCLVSSLHNLSRLLSVLLLTVLGAATDNKDDVSIVSIAVGVDVGVTVYSGQKKK